MSTSPGRSQVAHLHNHTMFSTLDAIQRLDEMCAAAVADGQTAIAATDHGTLAGLWKFRKAANRAGIKPILGSEMYLAIGSRHEHGTQVATYGLEGEKTRRYHHLTLLARNREGWRNLLALNNRAAETVWYKPRIDLDLLAEHSRGLVIGSGCLGGPVASRLLEDDHAGARTALGALRDIAEDGHLFVEVMEHGIPAERVVQPALVELARDMGLPVVATNDAHYTHEHECDAHDAWLAVGVGAKISDPGRFRFDGAGYHLRTAAQMDRAFAGHPAGIEAVRNTLLVAQAVEDDVMEDSGLKLPRFHLPAGHPDIERWGTHPDEAAYLHHLVLAGAKAKYGTPLPQKVKDRLRTEEDVIVGAGIPGYFLIVKDMIDAARAAGHRVGFGRGSAGGALCGFVLGIHGVDPLEHGLLFERFLDPTRVGMPDIDTDFDEAGAAWVAAEYLPSRWGHDHVARIGSFGMSLSRRAIRTVASAAELSRTGDELARLVPIEGGGKPMTFGRLLDESNQAGEAFRAVVAGDAQAARVVSLAGPFEGVVANESIHACGILVSDRPLDELVPTRIDTKTGVRVTQWDGKDVDEFGMLKLDDLAIRNLTVVSKALELIEARTGERVDVDSLDMGADDERTKAAWRLLGQGRTAGLFQIESAGMSRLIEQVRPEHHGDLSAVLALYRPGPMGAGMHEHYAARKHGLERVDYGIYTPVPAEQAAIASVLDSTFGLVVFQESLMALSTVVAGFTAAERNRLRKAFSKKIRAEMDALKEQFMAGATSEAILPGGSRKIAFRAETAENLWRTFDASASYLFNACVLGETVVLNGKSKPWTVERLYFRLYGNDHADPALCPYCEERPRRRHVAMCARCASWHTMFADPSRGFHLLAVDSTDGRIRPQRVEAVHANGVKPVFTVRTAGGRELTMTGNHRVLTPDGYRRCEQLMPGDELVSHEGYEPQVSRPSDRTTTGQRTPSPDKKPWLPGPLNSGYVDGGFGRRRRWDKGHVAGVDTVLEVVPAGERMTYDVEMTAGTDHNFVANGLVSHNSHSAAYAVLTFVTAYLKANWPAEYGAALLSVTSKDDKRVGFLATLRDEGLAVLAPDVNAGGVGTSVDAAGNIRLGLAEVKGAGAHTAAIVAERDANGPFVSLADLMARVKVTTGRPATSRARTLGPSPCHACLRAVDGTPEDRGLFGVCACGVPRTSPRTGDEPRVEHGPDGSVVRTSVTRSGDRYRLVRWVTTPVLDAQGRPVMATENLSVGLVEALIEAGACDGFGPRAGLVAVVRAVRDCPDLPVPDLHWGIVEQAAKQRDRLGLVVGEHPMRELGPQVAAWTGSDGRRGSRPVPVHRLPDVPTGPAVTAGIVASWDERSYSRGRMARLVLEGSRGSVQAVVWDEALAALHASGQVPGVGDVVAVAGTVRRRAAAVKVSDFDDGDQPGGQQPDETPERVELTAQLVWRGPLATGESMGLEPGGPLLVGSHLTVVRDEPGSMLPEAGAQPPVGGAPRPAPDEPKAALVALGPGFENWAESRLAEVPDALRDWARDPVRQPGDAYPDPVEGLHGMLRVVVRGQLATG